MIELRNGRVSLALHALQQAEGLPLLLVHELGGSADDFRTDGRAPAPAWPGPTFAIDLSGHGRSGRVYGGGYYPELWVADTDLALAALAQVNAGKASAGEVVVIGRGLGAYVALLLAGGRPEQVRCAVLCAGAGSSGADAPTPSDVTCPDIVTTPRAQCLLHTPGTDPNALEGQDTFLRPPDYAARFAERARRVVLVEDGTPRPSWWRAVAEVEGVQRCGDVREALALAR